MLKMNQNTQNGANGKTVGFTSLFIPSKEVLAGDTVRMVPRHMFCETRRTILTASSPIGESKVLISWGFSPLRMA